jgi:hypothetical protein
MSADLFKKAFIASGVDLYLAVLDRIKFENDFAAYQRFQAERQFQSAKQFQSEQGFREANLFKAD